MSASKLSAQPGDRFTDPDGGTWVLTNCHTFGRPWFRIDARGGWGWHPQQEAEEAVLFELVSLPPGDRFLRKSSLNPPLNPRNPEHLRQVAEFLTDLAKSLGNPAPATVMYDARWLRVKADFLDREAREKAQEDAADRKRAEEIARDDANSENPFRWCELGASQQLKRIDLVLAGIQAGRAEAES